MALLGLLQQPQQQLRGEVQHLAVQTHQQCLATTVGLAQLVLLVQPRERCVRARARHFQHFQQLVGIQLYARRASPPLRLATLTDALCSDKVLKVLLQCTLLLGYRVKKAEVALGAADLPLQHRLVAGSPRLISVR